MWSLDLSTRVMFVLHPRQWSGFARRERCCNHLRCLSVEYCLSCMKYSRFIFDWEKVFAIESDTFWKQLNILGARQSQCQKRGCLPALLWLTKNNIVKTLLSGPLLSGHPLWNEPLSNSQKAFPLFTVNFTSTKRSPFRIPNWLILLYFTSLSEHVVNYNALL